MVENSAQTSVLSHIIRLLDLVESRNDGLIGFFVDLISDVGLNLGHEWHRCSHLLLYLVHCMQVLNFDRITLPIGRLQMTWAAIAYEPTVDHDSNSVT